MYYFLFICMINRVNLAYHHRSIRIHLDRYKNEYHLKSSIHVSKVPTYFRRANFVVLVSLVTVFC